MTRSPQYHQSPLAPSLTPVPAGTLQRACACGQHTGGGGECAECRKKREGTLQRAAIGDGPGVAPPIVHDVLRSPGQPLDAATRDAMEPRFGHDFSRVRVHADAAADASVPGRNAGARDAEHEIENLKNKEFKCPPVADSVKNTQSVGGVGTLGFTKIDKSSNLICAPVFEVDAKGGFCTFQPRPISLSITSKFPKVEEVDSGQTMQLPNCGKKDVPVFTRITTPISTLVRDGEQEHCDDLNLAFKQTLEPCGAALSKLAGQKLTGKNDDECFASLIAKLGFNPIECTKEFIALSKKTDERDSLGLHDFDPELISKTCDKIVVGNKKSATNKIGDPSVAPNKLIPAATKCGTAAAAPAPSSAPAPSAPPSSKPAPPAPPPSSPKTMSDEGAAE